jgi:hypothetical protein
MTGYMAISTMWRPPFILNNNFLLGKRYILLKTIKIGA